MLQTSIAPSAPFKKIRKKTSTINALLVACIGMVSVESHAVTMYGKMVGTITGYEDGGSGFNTWFSGSSASPIGTTIEYNFYVHDWAYTFGGSETAPVVNTSSDPLHYGIYNGYRGTSYEAGNLQSGQLYIGEKLMPTGQYTAKQTLVNDLAPGDRFTWNTSYFPDIGYASSIDFSLTTLQNILTSGFTTQEFYWLDSNDSTGGGTGVLLTDPRGKYTFNIDRLSLTLSENPTPPAPIPLPGSAWLLGTALAGLLTARKASR